MTTTITPCLWFDNNLEEAASFEVRCADQTEVDSWSAVAAV